MPSSFQKLFLFVHFRTASPLSNLKLIEIFSSLFEQGRVRIVRRTTDETAGRPEQSARFRGRQEHLPAHEQDRILKTGFFQTLPKL